MLLGVIITDGGYDQDAKADDHQEVIVVLDSMGFGTLLIRESG